MLSKGESGIFPPSTRIDYEEGGVHSLLEMRQHRVLETLNLTRFALPQAIIEQYYEVHCHFGYDILIQHRPINSNGH